MVFTGKTTDKKKDIFNYCISREKQCRRGDRRNVVVRVPDCGRQTYQIRTGTFSTVASLQATGPILKNVYIFYPFSFFLSLVPSGGLDESSFD